MAYSNCIARHGRSKVFRHTEFSRRELIAASIDARTIPSGAASPQLPSRSFSWFFPKLSRLPKIYRSFFCGTAVGRPLLVVSFPSVWFPGVLMTLIIKPISPPVTSSSSRHPERSEGPLYFVFVFCQWQKTKTKYRRAFLRYG